MLVNRSTDKIFKITWSYISRDESLAMVSFRIRHSGLSRIYRAWVAAICSGLVYQEYQAASAPCLPRLWREIDNLLRVVENLWRWELQREQREVSNARACK